MSSLQPAETIVAALVSLSGGELSLSLEKAVHNLERWQCLEDRHFGTEQPDIRSSLAVLWFFDERLRARCPDRDRLFVSLQLRDIVPILLTYEHFYANDEGAYWVNDMGEGGADNVDEDGLEGPRDPNMQRFFALPHSRDAFEVTEFLRQCGFDRDRFIRSSRPGEQS